MKQPPFSEAGHHIFLDGMCQGCPDVRCRAGLRKLLTTKGGGQRGECVSLTLACDQEDPLMIPCSGLLVKAKFEASGVNNYGKFSPACKSAQSYSKRCAQIAIFPSLWEDRICQKCLLLSLPFGGNWKSMQAEPFRRKCKMRARFFSFPSLSAVTAVDGDIYSRSAGEFLPSNGWELSKISSNPMLISMDGIFVTL